MNRCIFTVPSRNDLRSIHDFIARDDVETALRFAQHLEQRCKDIVDMPGMGRRRDDLSPGLRSIIEGKYIILYRLKDQDIHIMRVLQGSQDLPRQFDEN